MWHSKSDERRMATFLALVLLLAQATLSRTVSAQGEEAWVQVDERGRVIGEERLSTAASQGSAVAAREVASPVSILIFHPELDTPDRLRALGYSVVETTDGNDLARENLQNYDVLWLDVGSPNQWAPVYADPVRAWIAEDGGGLIFTQPNDWGEVEIFPPGFEVTVYDDVWPGWPGSGGHAVIVDGSHPITMGLGEMDIAGNGDWVWKDDIGTSWDILGVDELLPDDVVALIAGEYGEGRMVFNTGNFSSQSSDPGTDQYVIQLLTWLSQKEPPPPPWSIAATVGGAVGDRVDGACGNSSMLNHLAFLLLPLALVLVLRRVRKRT